MSNAPNFKTPYLRPWMKEYGAAAAASPGSGLKGIVAGKIMNCGLQAYASVCDIIVDCTTQALCGSL